MPEDPLNDQPSDGSSFNRAALLKRVGALGAGAMLGGGIAPAAYGEDEVRSRARAGGGGTLHIAFTDANIKDAIDPAVAPDTLTETLATMLFDPLVAADNSWNVHPALATSWTVNSSGTEYTFHLRKGVRFHNGKPLTANDVAYTFKRMLQPKLGATLYPNLHPFLESTGIQVINSHTITFKLKKPNFVLLPDVASLHAVIVPAEGGKAPSGIGTGPFKLKSFKPGQGFQLVRNPDYWQAGVPKLDGVNAFVESEQATKIQSVVSGQNHLGDPITYSLVPTVKAPARILSGHNQIYFTLVFDATMPPFTDNRVRTALKLAFDRETFVQQALHGYGTAVEDVPVLPSDPTYPPALKSRKQDIAQAKKLLAAAGHPNGLDFTLYTSQAYAAFIDIAVVFKQLVAPAGFQVTLNEWPASTYWNLVWEKKAAYLDWWANRQAYTALAIDFVSTAPWNEQRFKSPQFDKTIASVPRLESVQKRVQALRQANMLVANNSGAVIPFFADTLWVAKQNLHGLKFSTPYFIDIKEATVA